MNVNEARYNYNHARSLRSFTALKIADYVAQGLTVPQYLIDTYKTLDADVFTAQAELHSAVEGSLRNA